MNYSYNGESNNQNSPYYYYRAEWEAARKGEIRRLRYIGSIAGGCVILYVILQNVLSMVYAFEPFYSVYARSATFRSFAAIILSILSLLLPFVLGGIGLRKKKMLTDLRLEKPVSYSLMLSSVPFGFLICLTGNYLTSVFLTLTRNAGVELSAPDYTVPESFAGRIVYAVSIAAVPALVEEFAMRGVVMQPLRRYGDKFAILASAAVFAILHGNLVQAPFAFIAGIGIGYAVCITNSIWTGVLIHFCNNFYSVAVDFLLNDITDEALLNVVWNLSQVMLYAVCIIGSVIFVIIKGRRKLVPAQGMLTSGEKWRSYFINIPMIIAIVIMLVITANYIKLI